MGEDQGTAYRPNFNGSLEIEGRGDRLTSHAGVVLLRELDDKLGLTRSLSASIADPRDPSRVRHSQSEVLRSWLYAMASESTTSVTVSNRAEDPALRMAASDKRGVTMLDEEGGRLASQPTRSRLLANLATEGNLEALRSGLFDSAARAIRAMNEGQKLSECTLDIDSYPLEVHGHQAGSEFNGHYGMRCFHPLGVMVGETGHWLDLALRRGNVHTAEGAEDVLLPLVARSRGEVADKVHVRGDAGFVGPKLLDPLDAEGVRYAFRLRTNRLLKSYEEIHARRPVGRPTAQPRTWCHDLEYRAETWKEPRRVVMVVQERPGELYLHTFFIVTSFSPEELCARDVLDFYRARGTMEGHIGELQSVINGALSSANRPKAHIKHQKVEKRAAPIDPRGANAAALLLHGIAYNLMNTLRLLGGTSGYPDEPAGLGLRRARSTLVALAGRIVVSARRAKLIVSQRTAALWARVTGRIRRLSPPVARPAA